MLSEILHAQDVQLSLKKKNIKSKQKYCNYNGQHYCNNCHNGRKHIIPSQIIYNWEFKEFYVCNDAYSLLMGKSKEPLIDIGDNSDLYRRVLSLNRIKRIRIQLVDLYDIIQQCSSKDELYENYSSRLHLFKYVNIYSLSDLSEIASDNLFKNLYRLLTVHISHVRQLCTTCKKKGKYCSLCKKKEFLFAFEYMKVRKCMNCEALFHLKCFSKIESCPVCDL